MSETVHPTDTPRTWRPLEAKQRRVLGVLVEKAKTTPAGYPMTVNSIVTGCNQKSNRDPLTAYEDIDVERALSALGDLKAVSEIDWMGRSSKFKHHAHEWLAVSRVELAVMTELLLRGAQALGDLRARAARMEPIADLEALKPIVDALLARGLMVALTPPGRGQIVTHGLYLDPEMTALRAQHSGGGRLAAPAPAPAPAETHVPVHAAPATLGSLVTPQADLRTEVASLRDQVIALRADVQRLQQKLNEAVGD